jgi:D-ribose pyranose/furanose isomerase RbsD
MLKIVIKNNSVNDNYNSDEINKQEIQGLHKRMVQFQKLTRNLFLTFHGHNIHRQQRQLSKFLVRYQQFASHAYCGAIFQDGVASGKGFPCAPF